jgi:hypothetical protein
MATKRTRKKENTPDEVKNNEPEVKTDKTPKVDKKSKKKDKGEKLPTWRKIGGGSFRLNGVEQKNTFKAKEEDIPKAFRNLVERVK